ncbi:MAG: TatD family hydrolase [Candidatus Paceibacterota bacterium]
MLIDTHCHLDFKDFDEDRDDVIKRAYDAGVQKIINVGCDLERSKSSVALADKYNYIYASVGLHPQEANNTDEKIFSEIEELAKHPKTVAIGECGLEYSGPASHNLNKEKQKEVFLRHLELSQQIQKPVIIHCRSAYEDLIEILKTNSSCGVVHFFSGKLAQVKQLLDLRFLISFTGVITFSRDYDRVIQSIPLDRILIETDAPFVAPVPYRGTPLESPRLPTGQARNEPAYVIEIAKKIAEIKNISFEKIAEQTAKNAIKLFSI